MKKSPDVAYAPLTTSAASINAAAVDVLSSDEEDDGSTMGGSTNAVRPVIHSYSDPVSMPACIATAGGRPSTPMLSNSLSSPGAWGKSTGDIESGSGSLANSRPPSPTVAGNRYSTTRKPMEKVNPEMYQRYKYYMKLAPPKDPGTNPFTMPDHVLPKDVWLLPLPTDAHGKQSSITTIFSIWNTMIGSSLLSMPYAINEAGFLMGMFLMLLMCAICLYTCTLILKHDQGNGINGKMVEFAALAKMYLGKFGSWASVVASVGIFWGAALVYCILMSTFMFSVADTIAFWANGSGMIDSSISAYFTPEYVSVALMVLVFPLTLVKDFSFFAKFTSVGTISVVYMICFTIYWAANNGLKYTDATLFGNKFYYFTGILTLSFFIHNAILSITRNQKHPEHNTRDISIAFILVCVSYMLVGFLYYFSTEVKASIADNFLTDVQKADPGNAGLFIAQFLLLFQMVSVFPLLVYVIRFQFMDFFYANPYPSFSHVLALNACVAYTSILMAVYFRNISTVLRYTGAIFGLVAVYVLPVGFHLKVQHTKGQLTTASAVFHVGLIVFGVANLVAQFF